MNKNKEPTTIDELSEAVQNEPESAENTDTTVQEAVDNAEEAASENADSPNVKPAKPKLSTAKRVQHFILLNIGTLLLAAGVSFFKAPNHFATGGVSGVSILLAPLLEKYLKQSDIMLIINVLIILIGFIFLEKKIIFRTLYCSLVYSAESVIFERFLPIERITGGMTTLTNQPFMELVYAMLLTGIGSAIIFNCKASSGGTDIVALILKKYTSLDTGKALLVTDLAIACCSFSFGMTAGLYSILGLFSKAFIVDGVIENIGKTKYITIITSVPDAVGDYIINVIKRDFTSYKATGGYTGNEKTVLVTVCKRTEALKLKAQVKQLDAAAFVIITDANEILGKGFRES